MRVLYVDDNAELADIVTASLTAENDQFEIETATGADEAVDQLTTDIDCVVSDYIMPDKNGLTLLEAVRAEHPALPFILYTNKGSEEIASTAISKGVTDYIQKKSDPSQYAILANRITNAVEQYRAKRTAEKTKQQLSELTEETDDVMYMFTADWEQLLFVNSAYEDLWGRSVETLESNPASFLDGIHPQDRDAVISSMKDVSTGQGSTIEFRILQPDGEQRWVHADSKPVFDETDTLTRIVGFVRDITVQKKREQELATARNRYEMLFENNPIVIWEHDFSAAKTHVDKLAAETTDLKSYLTANPTEIRALFDRVTTIDVNQNAVEYYNAESKTHLLNNVDQVLDVEAGELTADLWASVAAGETQFRGETVAQTFDGERLPQMLDLYVPAAHADDYKRVYMTGTDITTLKQRERELQRERDRLDQFASLVSHDLKNPLLVAQCQLTLARQESDNDHLEKVSHAHERMDSIITELLTLERSTQDDVDTEPVKMAPIVETCWQRVNTAAATYTIASEPQIQADSGLLTQLFENLFRNAVDHGGEAVQVTIGTIADGFYVEDNGSGVDADSRDTIFEWGYSTKQGGTGLGLYIVKQVVDAHGWEIHAVEGSDGGLRFEITDVAFITE